MERVYDVVMSMAQSDWLTAEDGLRERGGSRLTRVPFTLAESEAAGAPRSARRPQHSGFTLIELLVVIAIIAILASMLLSALSRAREKSKVPVCAGNLKQFGMAMGFYVDEHEGWLPAIYQPWAINADDYFYAKRGSLLDYLPPLPNRDSLHCPVFRPK
jgi:prepilin-type N-terminal cleavage/methylation domain-containing protein